jgi:hypothetical protein
MALWLVTAIWIDDDAELTQQWEINAASQDEATRDVVMLLPTKPHHVEATRLPKDAAPDLGPGQARKLG